MALQVSYCLCADKTQLVRTLHEEYKNKSGADQTALTAVGAADAATWESVASFASAIATKRGDAKKEGACLCLFFLPCPLLSFTAHPSGETLLEKRELSFNSAPADIFCAPATVPGASGPSSSDGTITTEPSCEGSTNYPFKRSFFFQGLLQAVQAKVLSDTKTPSASTAAFLWLLATKVFK